MFPNMLRICYVVSCAEGDGVQSCGHRHRTVAAAMKCLTPDGGGFIRAFDAGVFRSLNETELITFLEELENMPWDSCKLKSAQSEGNCNVETA
jgi:hypothetical protein